MRVEELMKCLHLHKNNQFNNKLLKDKSKLKIINLKRNIFTFLQLKNKKKCIISNSLDWEATPVFL
jgi:hypothetical protein